jgi:hypothetical protein
LLALKRSAPFGTPFIAESSRRRFSSSAEPGLPNGGFANQKYHFSFILEGLGTAIVGIFSVR